MTNLNDLSQIRKLDKENVLGSVEALPDQCWHAWEDAQKINVPQNYHQVKAIVMTGMGGSGLGARMIESVFGEDLKIPLVRVNDYNLPGFVDKNTLVICSSYSGSTEETVENAKQAIRKGSHWMAIGTGGKLLELAKHHKAPFYQIEPKFNPSKQPRMAIGYSVVGQLVLVSKAGIFHLTESQVKQTIETMRKTQKKLKVEIPAQQNAAKKLAKKMAGKIIAYIAARHLTGALHTVKNQLSENSKGLAARYDIPELNHFLMEGLKHPKENRKNVLAFLAQSNLYPERIQKRITLTQDVVEKNHLQTFVWKPKSQTKLSQAFELIQFGAYVNFYLSMLYGIDPAPIPWVDYFKKKLKK